MDGKFEIYQDFQLGMSLCNVQCKYEELGNYVFRSESERSRLLKAHDQTNYHKDHHLRRCSRDCHATYIVQYF